MASQATITHGVMEGGGSYNVHARVPAGGASLALPFLEQAVQGVTVEGGTEPIVIADYGSSQGKNSLAPMRVAIQGLRARVGPERPIFVVHIDQAANDFNTLFDVLHKDPERYSRNDPKIYPSAIGRSFYESVLPGDHVHLGWSSYAAVWLSRIPMSIPDHFIALASKDQEVRAAFQRQAAEDWASFLSLRASELRPGGRLVVVLPGNKDDGGVGFEPLFTHANEALPEMVRDGTITSDERSRMALGAYPRRRTELLEPFADSQFRGLTVEHCDLSVLPDAAWLDYDHDGNKEVLVNRHVGFFRAIFVPSLASALPDGKKPAFTDALVKRLKQRLSERPTPLHSFVQTMVLAKQDPTTAYRETP
jgi:hypothetical protein